MRNYFLLILIFISFSSCKKKSITENKSQVEKTDSLMVGEFIYTSTGKFYPDSLKTKTADYSNKFDFKDYLEYKMTDTIQIDLNGNGILESVYFDNNDCSKILIKEKGQELISFGCGQEEYDGFPNAVGWVNLWCVVKDKKVWEVLFTEDGDIDKDTIVNLERPSIYIGKEEAGGGIISYRNGKLYWIHQSD
ncbi:hypothetical protein [Nonlabens ulvanivorans]|uniref:Uncharacterized protein n=1 Tax=Nonlabens ulvanivorans TaxID=906888 RepID=A0A084JZS0_NONUL|nr:hypothetical protein [Nonlabens ulvanivorans]KEZ94454.1 hypothetical protein IL45_01365 [Nonlabens ulvanivorans]PRX12575.1 hypothetical protein LY02_02641 [Nonlabens ulvanivorans]